VRAGWHVAVSFGFGYPRGDFRRIKNFHANMSGTHRVTHTTQPRRAEQGRPRQFPFSAVAFTVRSVSIWAAAGAGARAGARTGAGVGARAGSASYLVVVVLAGHHSLDPSTASSLSAHPFNSAPRTDLA
jgi:hypothetical protein